MRRIAGIIMIVFTLLAASGVARADNEAGLITGAVAQVGAATTGCSIGDPGTVSGQGLMLPHLDPAPGDRVYSLSLPSAAPGVVPENYTLVDSDGDLLVGSLELCGFITGVGGGMGGSVPYLGPWCGMSKSYNGKGKQVERRVSNNAIKRWYQITDMGWKVSSGIKIVGLGKMQEANFNDPNPGQAGELGETKKAKKPNFHQLLVVATVRNGPGTGGSGSTCSTAGVGATSFQLDAVVSILHPATGDDKEDVVRLNDVPGLCKGPNCPFRAKPNPKAKPS